MLPFIVVIVKILLQMAIGLVIVFVVIEIHVFILYSAPQPLYHNVIKSTAFAVHT